MNWLIRKIRYSLWWRRLTHRIDPAMVAEAHILAAAARAGRPMVFQDAPYVSFSESGVRVDLARYLATDEGRDAVIRACADTRYELTDAGREALDGR